MHSPLDLRTLALARPELSQEALDGVVAYQRAVIDTAGSPWPSEARAIEASGLERGRLEVLLAAVRDFCGRRWAVRKLAARRAELASHRENGRLTPKDAEKLSRLEEEGTRVNDLSDLEARYGKEGLELLRAREDELLSLHERLHRR